MLAADAVRWLADSHIIQQQKNTTKTTP